MLNRWSWNRWMSEASPAAQVALDAAIVGFQQEPQNPGYAWALPTRNETVPWFFSDQELEPGVSWEELAQARGNVFATPNRRWVWLTPNIGMGFCLVPAGQYQRGTKNPRYVQRASMEIAGHYDTELLNSPPHTVTLTRCFYLAQTAVTNAQYRPFIQEQKHSTTFYFSDPRFCRDEQPVVAVSYLDVLAWMQWASSKTGLQFRLPTDAEWEWSARGPDGRPRPWGKNEPTLEAPVNVSESGGPPMVWQFFDGIGPFGCLNQAGGVAEWCEDYLVPFGEAALVDPVEKRWLRPRHVPRSRVVRGASWGMPVKAMHSFFRGESPEIDRKNNRGFRPVLVV